MGTGLLILQNLSKTVVLCSGEVLAILLSVMLRSSQQTSLILSLRQFADKEGVVPAVGPFSASLLEILDAMLLHPQESPRAPSSAGESKLISSG